MEDEESEVEKAKKREGAAVDRMGGAVFALMMGGLAGASLGPEGLAVAPAIAAVTGPWFEELTHIARVALHRRMQRANRAVEVASEVVGVPPEKLSKVLINDELIELTARVIEAAGASTTQQMIEALGRSLGQAINDPAQVDLETLVLNTLIALEAPHIKLLAALEELPEHGPESGLDIDTLAMDSPLWHTWTKDQLEHRHPQFRGATTVLASRISSLGLLDDHRTHFSLSQETFLLSSFGRLVLSRLRRE